MIDKKATLAILFTLSIILFGCENQKNIEYDENLIESVAFGSKEFAYPFENEATLNYKKELLFNLKKDTFNINLELKGILFSWGAETTGYPFKRILYFKSKSKELAIPFFDEPCFDCGNNLVPCKSEIYKYNMASCRNSISIDDQLNFIALEMHLSEDSLALEEFVEFTFSALLGYPKIELADTTKYVRAMTDWKNHCSCCENVALENIRKIFRNITKKQAKYYEADQIGGFWEIKTEKSKYENWRIKVDYVNEECAYAIRF